jgi:hypothetical protein
MTKLLFNYSFYSHPEIGKFQGVTVTSCGREKMGHLDPLVASSLAYMTKHLVNTRISKILSKRQNHPSILYLVTARIRVFGQNPEA